MTSWLELRTVALVGTDRRALPEPADGSLLERFVTEVGPEHAALQAAALLGTARRASAPIAHTEARHPEAQLSGPVDIDLASTAPVEAEQLLELMLAGNAGPGSMSDDLLEQWYVRAAERGVVVPHRLLVTVLDGASTTSRLRSFVRPVLGSRGRWLARQRDKWSWAAVPETASSAHPAAITVDVDELLLMSGDQQTVTLNAARDADASAGRLLIAEACEQLDATSRARVLGCLAEGLSDDDEELLQMALDDRSKGVRALAIMLLNRLPGSARAARLARQLESMVAKSGRLRSTITVTYPDPPADEQLRDLPPQGSSSQSNAVVEQQWFDAIIAGAPLSWWETTLDMTPAKIVRTKSNFTDELLAAWSAAAISQNNQAWLEALFDYTQKPELLTSITRTTAAAAAFIASTQGKADLTTLRRQANLLAKVPGPWLPDFSRAVVDWARRGYDGVGSQAIMNQIQAVTAERLHPSSQTTLTDWLETVRTEEHQALQRILRNLIQQLSFRTSIDKAFS